MKKSELKPRGDLIVVEKHKSEEEKTEGGIVIPQSMSKAGFTHATVVAVGPGHYLENGQRAVIDDMKVGDTVLIDSQKSLPLSIDDNKTFILNQTAVLAVVEGDIRGDSGLKVHMPDQRVIGG